MKATILPIFANVEWPSAAVAIAIILVLGVLIAITIVRFTMDEVLKLWAAAGPKLSPQDAKWFEEITTMLPGP